MAPRWKGWFRSASIGPPPETNIGSILLLKHGTRMSYLIRQPFNGKGPLILRISYRIRSRHLSAFLPRSDTNVTASSSKKLSASWIFGALEREGQPVEVLF